MTMTEQNEGSDKELRLPVTVSAREALDELLDSGALDDLMTQTRSFLHRKLDRLLVSESI